MEKVKNAELKAEMARNGHTQEKLCSLLKLPQTTISRKLAGKTEWKKHEIDILGKYRGDIKCGDQLSFTMEKD